MNILDLIVIGILGIFMFLAYRKGFIIACLGFLPMALATAATYLFQPTLSKLARATPFFDMIKNGVIDTFDLSNIISESALRTQTEMIQQMKLPDAIQSALIENNNPVVYKLLDVTKLEDYIGSFIANACLNIICGLALFVTVLIFARLLLRTLNLVASLPVLSAVNKVGGLCVGFLQGALLIWILGIGMTFFALNAKWEPVFTLLSQSLVAIQFYENNLLLIFLVKIFA